ncbi:MAG: hypothetical protein ACJ76H_09615 [Bacteriovoracaceae bacterium]
MNVGLENAEKNVVSLFGGAVAETNIPDPLETLLQETELILKEEVKLERRDLPMVSESQFPDQSMFVLDQQLGMLKESIGRIKFYLLDLDDLLPK